MARWPVKPSLHSMIGTKAKGTSMIRKPHTAALIFTVAAGAGFAWAADPATEPSSQPATMSATAPATTAASMPAPVPPALEPKAVVELFLVGIFSGDEKTVFDNMTFNNDDALREAQAIVGEA